MRPEILFPLFKDISGLSGIGVKYRSLLKKLAGDKIIDVIYHLPSSAIDRRYSPHISDIEDGQIVTLKVKIDEHIPSAKPYNKSLPYIIKCSNDTGEVSLVFFNAYTKFLKSKLPIGSEKIISGKVSIFDSSVQMTHPDYIENIANIKKVQIVEPVYPMAGGIGKKNYF